MVCRGDVIGRVLGLDDQNTFVITRLVTIRGGAVRLDEVTGSVRKAATDSIVGNRLGRGIVEMHDRRRGCTLVRVLEFFQRAVCSRQRAVEAAGQVAGAADVAIRRRNSQAARALQLRTGQPALETLRVGLRNVSLGIVDILLVADNADRCQNTDDRHNDEQFDERKTFRLFHRFISSSALCPATFAVPT